MGANLKVVELLPGAVDDGREGYDSFIGYRVAYALRLVRSSSIVQEK
jgi:hypothetical protein